MGQQTFLLLSTFYPRFKCHSVPLNAVGVRGRNLSGLSLKLGITVESFDKTNDVGLQWVQYIKQQQHLSLDFCKRHSPGIKGRN